MDIFTIQSGVYINSEHIPQAEKPQRLIDILEFVHRGVPLTPQDTGFHERHLQYYSKTARGFRLLSDDDQLLCAGHILLKIAPDRRLARLSLAFEASVCGAAWSQWARCRFHEIDPWTARPFLAEKTNMSPSTVGRRATSLRILHEALVAHHPARRATPQPVARHTSRAVVPRSIFDRGGSLHVLETLAPGTHVLRVATAYFTVPGYSMVVCYLTGAALTLLVGSEDAVDSIQKIIHEFTGSLSSGVPSWQKRETLRRLHTELVQGSTHIHAFEPRREPRLHGKLYIFDNDVAYVTSANLTGKGLRSNIETGQIVHHPDDVAYLIKRFEEYFGAANTLLHELLPVLENSWAFSDLAPPYLLYLRVLLELYFDVPDLSDRTSYQLAEFQRMIVGSVLHVLREHDGALLIAPTGTGKTVMAAYVAAALFPHTVRRIYVLCPNRSLEESWRSAFRAFGVTPEVITHGILQEKGRSTPASMARLESILRSTTRTDLVIVDECHVFKNPESQGYENLSSLLQGSDHCKAKRLFLTATPMSTGIEDLNTLLSMLSGEKLTSIRDIARSASVVNITLPFIAQRFGRPDANNRRRALRFGRETRSFPRIQFRTLRYTSPMETVFRLIGDLELRFARADRRRSQLELPGHEVEEGVEASSTSELLRLILMRRAESSPAALLRTIDSILGREYPDTFRPIDPDRLAEQLHELRTHVCAAELDTKLASLLELRRSRRKSERMLIFSCYTDTVAYLAREISRRMPELRVGTITGQTPQAERQRVMAGFAPLAQGNARRARKDGIDVLIASDTLAEGENLQDATLLVNYELHWTPLRLIQRVGRIDRPTKVFREADVVNFYPDGEQFEEMVQLWYRLRKRSEMYEVLASTNVIGEIDRDLSRADERDLGLVRAVYYQQASYEQLLSEYLPTSNHLVERAKASEDQVRRARDFPLGVRSARAGTPAGTFVLLRVHDRHHCVFREFEGELISSPGQVAHEALLAHIMAEPSTLPAPVSDAELDDAVSSLVESWCEARGENPEQVEVVCAEMIIPTN